MIPEIPDCGGFFLDDGEVPGAWAETFLFPHSFRIIPDMGFEGLPDAVEGPPDGGPAPAFSFHSPTDTPGGQHDHGA